MPYLAVRTSIGKCLEACKSKEAQQHFFTPGATTLNSVEYVRINFQVLTGFKECRKSHMFIGYA